MLSSARSSTAFYAVLLLSLFSNLISAQLTGATATSDGSVIGGTTITSGTATESSMTTVTSIAGTESGIVASRTASTVVATSTSGSNSGDGLAVNGWVGAILAGGLGAVLIA